MKINDASVMQFRAMAINGSGSGMVWEGTSHRYFLGRLKAIPPLLCWETPYRYDARTTWITMHVNALGYQGMCDFQLRMHQNR